MESRHHTIPEALPEPEDGDGLDVWRGMRAALIIEAFTLGAIYAICKWMGWL